MKMIMLALVGVAALISEAPGKPNAARSKDTALAEQTIKRLTAEFVAGYNSGDVGMMMHLHGPTYVDVNLPQPRQSRAERRAYYAKVLASGRSRIEVVPERVEVDRDHALVWGKLTIHRESTEPAAKDEVLRYMEAWQKLPEGWRATWGMDSEIFD